MRNYLVLAWSHDGRTQNVRHRKADFRKYVFFRQAHDKGPANYVFTLVTLDKEFLNDNVLQFVLFLDKEKIHSPRIDYHYSVAFQFTLKLPASCKLIQLHRW
jgi:hypothetical protein